jgi:flagellar basal body-associated protein FliL
MNKKLIFIMIPVLLLVLAAAGWMFMRPAPAAPVDEGKVPGPVHTMVDPFVVNLAGSPDAPRFVKVGVALRLAKSSESLLHPPEGTKPGSVDGEAQVRDIIISSLQSRSSADLSTEKGRTELKREIVRHVNKRTELRILDVYYTDFAVQ